MRLSGINTICIFLAAALLTGCSKYEYGHRQDGHYLLTIENQSGESITWIVPEHGSSACEDMTGELPESLTHAIKREIAENIVPPHSSMDIVIYESGSVSPFEEYHVRDVVTFYFFKTGALEENEWREVVKAGMWLERRNLSAEDVIGMKKKIIYKN